MLEKKFIYEKFSFFNRSVDYDDDNDNNDYLHYKMYSSVNNESAFYCYTWYRANIQLKLLYKI